MNSLSLIRFITGEYFVASVVEPFDTLAGKINDDGIYILKRPMQIIAQPDQQGRMGVALADYPTFGHVPGDDLPVMGSRILHISEPNSQFVSIYNKAVAQSSGLVLPSGGASGILLR